MSKQNTDLKHKESIGKKSAKIKTLFALPDDEVLVQNYFCSLGMKPGNMYITPNYCLYVPNIGSSLKKLPFRSFRTVENKKSILGNSILVVTEDNSYSFSKFVHYDEAFYLLDYIMKHPLIIPRVADVDFATQNVTGNSFGSSISHSQSVAFHSPGIGQRQNLESSYSSPNISNSVGGGGGGGGQIQVAPVTVDLQASAEALRRLQIARQYGAESLNELAVQGEMLNRIENNVESLHYNLDQANVHLNGVESISGQFSNSLFKNGTTGLYQNQAFNPAVVNMLESNGPEIINVLRKRENTSLAPSTITLSESDFVVNDSIDRRQFQYRYPEVKEIAIRNRALHLDLRFHNGGRERIVSAYSQLITNEIVLRNNNAQVVFETHAIKFEYGNQSLRARLQKTSKLARANEVTGGATGFLRHRGGNQVSAEVVTASDRYRADLIQQEQHIDQISDVLGDLHYMANAIGQTTDQQNDQIKRTTNRTEEANQKLQVTNQRMQNIILND